MQGWFGYIHEWFDHIRDLYRLCAAPMPKRPGRRAAPGGRVRSFNFWSVVRQNAKHAKRPGNGTHNDIAAGGGEAVLRWPLRGRARRPRREPGGADERDDAVFGAQGAEPATRAGVAQLPHRPRVKNSGVSKTQKRQRPIYVDNRCRGQDSDGQEYSLLPKAQACNRATNKQTSEKR